MLSTQKELDRENLPKNDKEGQEQRLINLNKSVVNTVLDNLDTPKFTRINQDAFFAEYCITYRDGQSHKIDTVIHFFLPTRFNQEVNGPKWRQYWDMTFPETLFKLLPKCMGVDKNRFELKYTEDLASWYVRIFNLGADRKLLDKRCSLLFTDLNNELCSSLVYKELP